MHTQTNRRLRSRMRPDYAFSGNCRLPMMFTDPASFMSFLLLVATLGVGVVPGRAETCTPPASMKTVLRAHPDADSYSQLGGWYANRRQFACAADAYRSALKLKPQSSTLAYLLGLNLFRAGDSAAAATSLENSLQLS